MIHRARLDIRATHAALADVSWASAQRTYSQNIELRGSVAIPGHPPDERVSGRGNHVLAPKRRRRGRAQRQVRNPLAPVTATQAPHPQERPDADRGVR
jgi:hypothetical protein